MKIGLKVKDKSDSNSRVADKEISISLDNNEKSKVLTVETGIFDNPNVQLDNQVLLAYIRENNLFSPPAERNFSRVYDPSEWGKELRKIFRTKVYNYTVLSVVKFIDPSKPKYSILSLNGYCILCVTWGWGWKARWLKAL